MHVGCFCWFLFAMKIIQKIAVTVKHAQSRHTFLPSTLVKMFSLIYIFERQNTQGRSQEFDLGGYKWVKETKNHIKSFKVD